MAPGKPSHQGPAPRRMGRFRRFVVAEESMAPTLRPGDGLLAVRTSRIRRGQIRVFEHPERPGFWLVKRVGDVRGTGFEAVSDNPDVAAIDSRRFGTVPVAGSYLMLVRVPGASTGRSAIGRT